MEGILRLFMILVVSVSVSVKAQYDVNACTFEDSTFELVTGWMYSAPQDILETRAGTLQLSECLSACKTNATCLALNFETGLCVLFRSQVGDEKDGLIKSQFPVFTMYAQKVCLPSARICSTPWGFDLVPGYSLEGAGKREMQLPTRSACMDACIQNRDFPCRSAWWNAEESRCTMSDLNRYSVSKSTPFIANAGEDYMENQCFVEPKKICDVRKIRNKLLKTVDSLHENVTTIEKCRELCINAPFKCHTYDYEGVCRLSHHSTVTLNQLDEPYLRMEGSHSYEMNSCYNVDLDCQSDHLTARLNTNKVFNGKVYARSRPNSCVHDIDNQMEFEIQLNYTDPNCGIRQTSPGQFTTDLVLQHHDQIMTSADMGLALLCSFDLMNKSVSHGVELQVSGQIKSVASQSAVVPSPNVTMRITDRIGGDIDTAQVGDPLSLRFEIVDQNSPYEIFVRDLIAMDGGSGAEILLVDSRGCPTDPSIMGSVSQFNNNGKILQTPFEAFKFPTSDVVQFQALVTPCLPSCQPVDCSLPSDPSTGGTFHAQSYGRRKRSLTQDGRNHTVDTPDNVLVINSIRIADRFKFEDQENNGNNGASRDLENNGPVTTKSFPAPSCLNAFEILACGFILLIVQVAVIFAWLLLWRRKRNLSQMSKEQQAYSGSAHYYYAQSAPMPHLPQQAFHHTKLYSTDSIPGYPRH